MVFLYGPRRSPLPPSASLATDHSGRAGALRTARDRERGEVTHRLMAEDLDISPLAAEMTLQALRPTVHEHYDIEEVGASLDELDIDDGAADDA